MFSIWKYCQTPNLDANDILGPILLFSLLASSVILRPSFLFGKASKYSLHFSLPTVPWFIGRDNSDDPRLFSFYDSFAANRHTGTSCDVPSLPTAIFSGMT